MESFLCYKFEGLIHGGAYFWNFTLTVSHDLHSKVVFHRVLAALKTISLTLFMLIAGTLQDD